MADFNALTKQVGELKTLKTLTRVYGEIAAMRMNKARASVLFTRKFLEQLSVVFTEVQAAYIAKVKRMAKKNKIGKDGKVTLLSHNGKQVAVLISANTRLYGDLVQRTTEMFMEDVKYAGAEATIVGRVGLSLFLEEEPNRPYTYFDFADHKINRDQLEKIIEHLVQYEEIHVYYGKYTNVLTQEPKMYRISSEISLNQDQEGLKIDYLFEPTLEDILMYFENEIFGSLFEQTISESQLAKFASRLVAMDRAEVNIETRLKKIEVEQLMSRHKTMNRKQLNSLAGVYAKVMGS